MQYDNQFPTDLNLDIVEPMGCTDCGKIESSGTHGYLLKNSQEYYDLFSNNYNA